MSIGLKVRVTSLRFMHIHACGLEGRQRRAWSQPITCPRCTGYNLPKSSKCARQKPVSASAKEKGKTTRDHHCPVPASELFFVQPVVWASKTTRNVWSSLQLGIPFLLVISLLVPPPPQPQKIGRKKTFLNGIKENLMVSSLASCRIHRGGDLDYSMSC